MRIWRGGHSGDASLPSTETFTGTAWMDLLHQEADCPPGDLAVTTVTFTPGVRTHWHHHGGGQLLVVLSGEGWVGTCADGRSTVRGGDLVWTPAGEQHWHGATDTTALTHLAVTLGATRWSGTPPETTLGIPSTKGPSCARH